MLRAFFVYLRLQRTRPTSPEKLDRLVQEYQRIKHRPGALMVLPPDVRIEDLRG